MATIKITSNGAVTLPAKYRKALGMEVGGFVNAYLEEGRIVIKPARVVDADDAWFHSRKWRKKEREADRDIAAGRVSKSFDDADALLEDLED